MKISLYIHIPFCVKKCLYCDFLSGPYDKQVRTLYIDALCKEIARASEKYRDYEVVSIFFGGGTPSILDGDEAAKIMDVIKTGYTLTENCEISMEVNPGTVSSNQDRLEAYKRAGINRLSIGLQSANDEELKILGRIHSYDNFEDTWKAAARVGFDNLNVDLISGIPGQSLSAFKSSLEKVVNLIPAPKHISVYSLIVEEGTPFYDMYHDSDIIDEELDRELYKITGDILEKYGYYRYEISNYAKPSYECRHNCVYWKRGNYVGFGIGAASLVNNIRWKNTSSMDIYLKSIKYDMDYMDDKPDKYDMDDKPNKYDIGNTPDKYDMDEKTDKYNIGNTPDKYDMDEKPNKYDIGDKLDKYDMDEKTDKYDMPDMPDKYDMADKCDKNKGNEYDEYRVLSLTDCIEEFMFLGLRMTTGISISEFETCFKVRFPDQYKNVIDKYSKLGFMHTFDIEGQETACDYDRVKFTEKGLDVSNYILSEFLLDK